MTGEAGRTVWIIHDLSSCFRRSAYPEYLFALTREDFAATVIALTEYEKLEEDFQALDRAYDELHVSLVTANQRINDCSSALAQCEQRASRLRTIAWVLGGLTLALGATTAILAVTGQR